MSIDKIGPPDPVSAPKVKRIRQKPADVKPNGDRIRLSDEAKRNADILRVRDMVMDSPSVRTDRVEEVRQKMKDPNYINGAVIDNLAEKFLSLWDI